MSFTPDNPGVYTVTLELNGDSTVAASVDFEVFNYIPVAGDVSRATASGSSSISIPLLNEISFRPDCANAVSADCVPNATVSASMSPDDIERIVILPVGMPNAQSFSCSGGMLDDCASGVFNYVADVTGATYQDIFTYAVTDIDNEPSVSGQIIVDFTEAVAVSATYAANSVYSDRDEAMSIDLSGGELAVPPGSDRYEITCSATALGGRLTGGLAGCGPTIPITTALSTLSFSYESDQLDGTPNFNRSATSNTNDWERFTISVTDTQNSLPDTVTVEFELKPQVRFSSASPAPFGFSISDVLTMTTAGGVNVSNQNCTNCHATIGQYAVARSFVASDAGGAPVVRDSDLLCEPYNDSVECSSVLSHNGSTTFKPLLADGADAIKRWINEGAVDD